MAITSWQLSASFLQQAILHLHYEGKAMSAVTPLTVPKAGLALRGLVSASKQTVEARGWYVRFDTEAKPVATLT